MSDDEFWTVQRLLAREFDRAEIDIADQLHNQMWGGPWRSYTRIRYSPVLFPRIACLERKYNAATLYVGVHLPRLRRFLRRPRNLR